MNDAGHVRITFSLSWANPSPSFHLHADALMACKMSCRSALFKSTLAMFSIIIMFSMFNVADSTKLKLQVINKKWGETEVKFLLLTHKDYRNKQKHKAAKAFSVKCGI